MRALGFGVLFVLALSSGGCSLLVGAVIDRMGGPSSFTDLMHGLLSPFGLLWLSGFVVCGFCVWGMMKISAYPSDTENPSPNLLAHWRKPTRRDGPNDDPRVR